MVFRNEVVKLFTNVRFKSYQKIKPFFENGQKKIRTWSVYLDAVKEPVKEWLTQEWPTGE